MGGPEPDVVEDGVYGYRRLDPVPAADELAQYYQSRYYDSIRRRGASGLDRLARGGEQAQRERQWLHATLYDDVRVLLEEHAPGRRVLDVGAGTGDLVQYLRQERFEAGGVEPSAEAAALAQERDLPVRVGTLESFADSAEPGSCDAVTLMNVLEHVPDPGAVLEVVRGLLAPGGVVCIRVPNDFSDMQLAAVRANGCRRWWIVAPDHINYFDYGSLARLLAGHGFEVLARQSDFPMELFLLFGDDYVTDPELGGGCHRRRVRFEMALPGGVRRLLYRALADSGMGRNCLLIARR